MRTTSGYENLLFPETTAKFPSTRYQGSKVKLVDWIWKQIATLDFTTCLDVFGGTGAIAYKLKREGKEATYNDLLRFNYYVGVALVENKDTRLSSGETNWILTRHPDIKYPNFVQQYFKNIYFTKSENAWIDQTITNIRRLDDPYKFALAFFALCQACIVKRPYNLFHRKNLYMRLSDVNRSFGNKTSWDRPFDEWFRVFVDEANEAIFDNGRNDRALNFDADEVPGKYDLVYIDTPYVSKGGIGVDYLGFYHFLEGLTMYDRWLSEIDMKSKHLRLKPKPNVWTDKKQVYMAFDQLFKKYRDSILVVSYRSDGIPSAVELKLLLKQYKSHLQVTHYGHYKYVLSKNDESKEILFIGT